MSVAIQTTCADCGQPISVMRRWATRCPECKAKHRQAYSRAYDARRKAIVPRQGNYSADIERAVLANLRAIRASHIFTLTSEDIYAQRGCGGASPPDDYAGITEAFRGARERSADDRRRQVEARKRQRREREAAGQCIRCAHPVTAPHVYCDHCRHKESIRARARRQAAKCEAAA